MKTSLSAAAASLGRCSQICVAGDLRRNRRELAANLAGSLRLEIDHVQMRRPAVEVDVDHRLLRRTDPRSRLSPQQPRERQPAADGSGS